MQSANEAFAVDFDNIRIVRMVIRVKKHGRVSAAPFMSDQKPRQIDIENSVAIHYEEPLREGVERVDDGAGGSPRGLLHDQPEVQAPFRPIATVVSNLLGAVAREHENVAETLSRNHSELAPEQRVAAHRRQRFRQTAGDGSKARARASGQNYDLRHARPRSSASSNMDLHIAAADERAGRHPSLASFSTL